MGEHLKGDGKGTGQRWAITKCKVITGLYLLQVDVYAGGKILSSCDLS